MRLLKINDHDALSLTEELYDNIPPYAILSHIWGEAKNEVTFDDLQHELWKNKAGHVKIRFCAQQTKRNKLEYFWVDTCCINKQSSAELSEAINSMYNWYRGAQLCYVYLNDVEKTNSKKPLSKSRWFRRGWTLQELLAPSEVIFYDRRWRCLGSKSTLARQIASITHIPTTVLTTGKFNEYSVAQKMSWSARRVTTRVEDGAYCLLGLFGVNMPLLYGEGQRAFFRLQEEIIRYNDDHSIFAWSMQDIKFSGLFAPNLSCFSKCHTIVPRESANSRGAFAMTNRGLSIGLKITPWVADTYLAYIDCTDQPMNQKPVDMGIFLRRLSQDDQYTRVNIYQNGLWRGSRRTSERHDRPIEERRVHVRRDVTTERDRASLSKNSYGFKLARGWLPPTTKIRPRNPSRDQYSAILHPGQWGAVLVLEFPPESGTLQQAALGFDFDFNPICLLRDSCADVGDPDFTGPLDAWSHLLLELAACEEDFEGSKIYRRPEHHGTRVLVGHRSSGLDVCLGEELSNVDGSIVSLKRDTSNPRPYWEFRIDNFNSPF